MRRWVCPLGLSQCSKKLILYINLDFYSQEKRKRQTEIENKKRQLEDDRRQLQHLKVQYTVHSACHVIHCVSEKN